MFATVIFNSQSTVVLEIDRFEATENFHLKGTEDISKGNIKSMIKYLFTNNILNKGNFLLSNIDKGGQSIDSRIYEILKRRRIK